MNVALVFIAGVIIGWLIEWVIDWFYHRRQERMLQQQIETLHKENDSLAKRESILAGENQRLNTALDTYEAQVAELLAGLSHSPGEVDKVGSQEQAEQAAPEISVTDEIQDEQIEVETDHPSGIGMAAAVASVATLIAAGEDDTVAQPPNGDEALNVMTAPELIESTARKEEPQIQTTLISPNDWVVEDNADPSVLEMDRLDDIAKFKLDIEYVEGIGPVYGGKLRNIGVTNPLELLQKGATVKGRQEIVEESGIRSDLILDWVNHVDLYRVRGVGSEYADMLEVAGVDTVAELARRNPENLHQKLIEVNAEKKRVRQLPGLAQVQDWVEQAKRLPRMISY